MELGPAEDSGKGTAEEHRVKKDESADCSVRVLTKNHQGDQPDSGALEMELSRSIIGHRDADNAKKSIEGAHKRIVDIFGVLFSGLELERTVVASENAREADQHLTEGRVDIAREETPS